MFRLNYFLLPFLLIKRAEDTPVLFTKNEIKEVKKTFLHCGEEDPRDHQEGHSKDSLHNDLKSNNVLLEKRGEDFNPAIIDFGKARFISNP